MATNELGHRLARDLVHAPTTLGVYRGGNQLPWLPGATIDAWVPCARGEIATGVPQPHVYFVQTLGARTAESGSIHCPECRAELAAKRAAGGMLALPTSRPAAPQAPQVAQSALPF